MFRYPEARHKRALLDFRPMMFDFEICADALAIIHQHHEEALAVVDQQIAAHADDAIRQRRWNAVRLQILKIRDLVERAKQRVDEALL